MEMLRGGDTLVVWRLDRLGRDLPHLLKLMENLHERAIVFRSLTESIGTSTPMGKLYFQMTGALAEVPETPAVGLRCYSSDLQTMLLL